MSFEEFWRVFPRRVAKFKARTAWDKARKYASSEEILEGARRYALEMGDSQYIKHPTTWLNQGCWLDEPGANNGHQKGYAELAEELRNGYDAGCSEDLFSASGITLSRAGRHH